MLSQYAPCPVCQSSRIHVAEWYTDSGEAEYYCVCDDCGYADPDRFEEEYVAVDHWNRRVSTGYLDGDDPTDTEYDRLDDSDRDTEDFDLVEELKRYEQPARRRRSRIER